MTKLPAYRLGALFGDRFSFAGIKGWLKVIRRHPAVKLAVLFLLAYGSLLSFFFRTLIRNYTYLEVFPRELVFPLAMHAITAIIIAALMFFSPWLRTMLGKMLATIVLALFMVGYDGSLLAVSGVIRAFIPGLTESDPMPLVSLIYLILLASISVALGVVAERKLSKISRVPAIDIMAGLAVLVAYLLVGPAYSLSKVYPDIVSQSKTVAPEFPAVDPSKVPAEKPDIYYIVLDRYANNQVLTDQFGFTNEPFSNFLRDRNFTVNDQAVSNYPFTAMSLAATMTGDYTNTLVEPYSSSDVQSRTLYHNLVWQSSAVKALKQAGYSYYSIGNWYGSSYKAPLADRDYRWEHLLTAFGKNKRLRGIEANEFSQSPYYRFAQVTGLSWWPLSIQEHDHVSGIKEQLSILNVLASKEQPGGRFIYTHMLIPHDPFVFNRDGSLSNNINIDSKGKPIKEKYVEQVEFINNQMQSLIEKIIKQSDGKAVILLNADEGPWPQVMNITFNKLDTGYGEDDRPVDEGRMAGWSDDWLKMKFGIQQAVHIPRATPDDLRNVSSVNLFRIVLNRYAGQQLDYLPMCQFGITKSGLYEYVYEDLTHRFTKTPDPSCKSRQTSH